MEANRIKDIYKQIGIYRITNTVNGKSYIGKTGMNFGDRWDSHRSLLRNGKHFNPYLQNAWNKYGEDVFEFKILQVVENVDDLNELEIQYISDYRERGISYNLSDGGNGGFFLGKHLSAETKRKIGDKNRIHMTGRKFSDEVRSKMSESQKRRYEKWTDADRAAYGKLVSERSRGYKWSEESKAAFSKLQREKPNGAKFTADDIRCIRRKKEEGVTLVAIAKEYNTSPSYISNIVHRRRWADVV